MRSAIVRRAARSVWGFVVGDDWVAALVIALGIAATAVVSGLGAPAWWTMPVAVLVALVLSVRRDAGG